MPDELPRRVVIGLASSRRLLQQRHADFDGIAQAEDPRRARKRLGQQVAEQRVPAAEFQDIGPACMTGEGVAERPQGSDQLVTRHFMRRQQDLVERQGLRVHDEVVVRLEQLRDQRRATTRHVKDEAGGRGSRRRLAEIIPGNVDERLRGRNPRDGFLHERVLELAGADLAQRKVQAVVVQDRARWQPISLNFKHLAPPALHGQRRTANANVYSPCNFQISSRPSMRPASAPSISASCRCTFQAMATAARAC